MKDPITRRQALRLGAVAMGITFVRRLTAQSQSRREFNIRDFGATGDGTALDTLAIQQAIDAAAAGPGSRVIVPGGRKYLIGALQLKGAIDFHLADDAELLVSTKPEDFGRGAALSAVEAHGLVVSGTGRINGRSREFMTHFDEQDEWWRPKAFRLRLMVLTGCRDFAVRDVTFFEAPSWTLHLVGCEHGQVDRVKIENQMDVPNCDGVDPDHCRDLEITNCRIRCGDDAIVVKATRDGLRYGASENIRVRDCVLETQDSGVKIGTETVSDIRGIRFERCEIKSGCRGCTIQLRDEGNVSDVLFRDITFVSRYHSAPWWGRGEGISLTALPRTKETKVGRISNVRIENVTGRAENSVRISGCDESRITDITLERVAVTMDRWTKYPGAVWDNRPTTVYPALEEHPTPAIHVRHADRVTLKDCRVEWGANRPEYFTHALQAHDVTALTHSGFQGTAAHPERDAAIAIS